MGVDGSLLSVTKAPLSSTYVTLSSARFVTKVFEAKVLYLLILFIFFLLSSLHHRPLFHSPENAAKSFKKEKDPRDV